MYSVLVGGAEFVAAVLGVGGFAGARIQGTFLAVADGGQAIGTDAEV